MKLICENTALEVEVSGSGDPTLIIHGFTGSASAMRPLSERLPGRKIVPDLVGHGRSESPASLDAYYLENISRQLSSLLQQLEASPASIVGYSLGGRIALHFALAHPEMVRSVALIGASPGIRGQDDRLNRKYSDGDLANSISQVGVGEFIEAWVAMPMWESLRDKLTADQWQESITQRRSNHSLGLANSLRANGTGSMNPLHDILGDLKAPTLLIAGDQDYKFLEIAYEMSDKIPDVSVEAIVDSGHAAHLEQPDATANAIIRHFSC